MYFPSHALELPAQRRVSITTKEQQENKEAKIVFNSLLKCQGGDIDSSTAPPPTRMLEVAQAHCVQVTHADCEEMIGEVTILAYETLYFLFYHKEQMCNFFLPLLCKARKSPHSSTLLSTASNLNKETTSNI